MRKILSLEGKTFGELCVIRLFDFQGHRSRWLCKCSCGNYKIYFGNALTFGKVISCGCKCEERYNNFGSQQTKHSHCADFKITPTYSSWQHAKSRCFNPNNKRYKDYGGRGITMCVQWINDFSQFLKDMGDRPSLKYSIDRINNNGNYEPGNCQWATKIQQANNQRHSQHRNNS